MADSDTEIDLGGPNHRRAVALLDWIRDAVLPAAMQRSGTSTGRNACNGTIPLGKLAETSVPGKICAACRGPASMHCSRCRCVAYCSRDCFKRHWKYGHISVRDALQGHTHRDVCSLKQRMDQTHLAALPSIICHFHRGCSHCGLDLLSLRCPPLLCDACGVSIYCSESCLVESFVTVHGLECEHLRGLLPVLTNIVASHHRASALTPNVCAACGAPAAVCCSSCGTRFCSTRCHDSELERHRAECAGIRARREEEFHEIEAAQAVIAEAVEKESLQDQNLNWFLAALRPPDSPLPDADGMHLPKTLLAKKIHMSFESACAIRGVDPAQARRQSETSKFLGATGARTPPLTAARSRSDSPDVLARSGHELGPLSRGGDGLGGRRVR